MFSSTTWGHQGSSLSESTTLQLERDALQCTGITEAGRCRAWGLTAAYGVLGTPRARIIRETVRSWFPIIHEATPDDIGEIRASWARDEIASNGEGSKVGIMSNLISSLFKAKWDR